MRFAELARPAQLYIVGTCSLALVEALLAAAHRSGAAPAELFALLVVAATIAHSFPVSTPGKQAYHVSLPFFIVALIVLAPLQLVALVGVVHVAEALRRRRSTVVQVFNAAAYIVTGLVAQGVYHALWSGQAAQAVDLSQPACLLASLAAAITFALLNRVLVSVAIWLGNRISPRHQHMFELEALLTDGVLLLMGVPLAHLALIAPWAAAVGAAPLWLIHRVLDLPNIRAQSRQDGLTELVTAPYLTETCTRELNRGSRFNRPVSLLLLDLDALGEVNAVHGHQAGDAVLRATARTISMALREYDLPARLAGGLFAVLLPETDLAQAQSVAERVRRSTAELVHEVPGTVEQVRITVSVGGTYVSGHSATANQVFEAAQAALARAKHGGGNQVTFQAVTAPALRAVPELEESGALAGPAVATLPDVPQRQRGTPGRVSSLARAYGQGLFLGCLAALGVVVCVAGAIAKIDWALLAVMLSASALAGMGFYFKSLPAALALATELNRSSARLVVSRYWRMWPQYVALGLASLLVVYAYSRLGLTVAIALGGLALLARYLAGRYVDRTLESVRKLRNANEALEHQAFHDVLTNLPNRALFAERMEHAMVRAGDGSVAVLFLDLDNFKNVNDTLGHAAGDALLMAASKRLVQCVRREDTIARLGGDEFTVLLEDLRDPSDAARMAERISDSLAAPFELEGQQVTVSSSIGIALDTDRSHRPDDLLREADMAMYRAKSGGKARYEIFDPGMAERAMERLELETELRHALRRGELIMHYVPIVSITTGALAALEAQVRWQHPRRGLLAPQEFMRVAEETGIVVDLGRWALQQSCRDANDWQSVRPGLAVQVDLSPRQLEQPDLVDSVRSAIQTAGLRANHLQLAVWQPAQADDAATTACKLGALAQLGVSLAINEVGVGPISLSWLSELPIRALALHPSVERSMGVVRAATAIGSAFGLTVGVQQGPPVSASDVRGFVNRELAPPKAA